MKGGPYKLLQAIRIWKSNVGDDGAAAIVSKPNHCCHLIESKNLNLLG
jgi:hypothetical protein